MGQLGLQGRILDLKEAGLWEENNVNKMKNMIYWVAMAFLQTLRAEILAGKCGGQMSLKETWT